MHRLHSSVGPVGIDYGSRALTLLQLRSHRRSIRVVGAARLDLPPTTAESLTSLSELREPLLAAFAAGGFTGRRCVVSLNRNDVFVQSLRMPQMPDPELKRALEWEASERFKVDRDAMEVDFVRMGEVQQGTELRDEILLIAAPHERIHARLDPILAAGLRPAAVEVGFISLARTHSLTCRRESDLERVRAIVEVGLNGSTILILRGDQISFCKPLAIGGKDFNEAVSERLQVDEESAREIRTRRLRRGEADDPDQETDELTERALHDAVRPLMGQLIKEIGLCLRYYGVTFRGQPPERIVLAGGDGLEPKLGAMISQACKLPVTTDDPVSPTHGLFGEIEQALGRSAGAPGSWSVAAGLSLRGISPGKPARSETELPARRAAA